MERQVYSVTEIAELLGVARGTAYALANSDDFPSVRISANRIVVPKIAFEQWLAQQASK